jgi:hypothetical protein
MKFAPKSKEQLAEEGLLPKGNYPFEVVGADDTKSKNTGADMIALNLRVFGPDGRSVFVKDWLLEAMGAKLRQFCDHVGVIDQYEAGTLCAADCEGKTGYVTLKIKKSDDFDPQNSVASYGQPKQKAEASAPAPKGESTDTASDDIPF